MPLIKSIFRYPVKGLSPQPLTDITLAAGQPFPFDRVFAMARPGAAVDAAAPKWGKKGLFVMLMLDEALAQVQTQLDVDTLQLTITRDGVEVLSADLTTDAGRATVETFFGRLLPRLGEPPRLVRASDGHFMDKPENVVSLINLATLRSLEQQWGRAIDPLRFRANFYIDGAEPWAEFDWIGSDLKLGEAWCRADRRNGRCGATNVNPATGLRDMEIPLALRRDFGHKDLGIYLIVNKAGKVAVGDTLKLPQSSGQAQQATASATGPSATPGLQRHICRGCYFVYDEAAGLPTAGIAAGTRFAELPPQWRCADCGTDKAAFKPYVTDSSQ
jgi:GntR family transcriptional regulator/MocR family aminotransferase